MTGEGGEGRPKNPEDYLREEFSFSDKEKKSSKKNAGPKISPEAAAVGGAVATEVGRRVFNKATEKAREVLGTSRPREKTRRQKPGAGSSGTPPGGEPPRPDEGGKENPIHNASFAEVMSKSNDPSLTDAERGKWTEEKELRVAEFKKFDNGDFVVDTERQFLTILRTSEWDAERGKGVYDRLISYAENRDLDFRNRHESDPRLDGLVGIAIRAEAAHVLIAGIDHKFEELDEEGKVKWLKAKNYTEREVERLRTRKEENHILDFAPDAPEEVVGTALKTEPTFEELMGGKREPGGAGDLRATERSKHREVARTVVPAHVGAVLNEGRNIAYAWDPFERKLVHGIQAYSVRDESGRRAWIFENIGRYDKLPGAAMAWKGATDDYLEDLETARANVVREEPSRQAKLELDSKILETRELMMAMMAVSASARAMERCAANPDLYLKIISQGAEKPDTDAQDFLRTFLLHDEPEKYDKVISDPLVMHYYRQILKDARLPDTIEDPEFLSGDKSDKNPEYHKVGRSWQTSRVAIATTSEIQLGRIKNIRDDDRENPNSLIYYLANKAEHGGFDAYIREVLLRRDEEESTGGLTEGREESDATRWAAAKLACDAFLVDKFTRWGFQLTMISEKGEIKPEEEIHRKVDENGRDVGKDLLSLSPNKDWGGDPFTNVIQPSFLPRIIKKVYEGEAVPILDLVDKAFRPDDIFYSTAKGYERLPEKILHPTATENLKALIRYNKAVGLFFGSSRAKDVGEYNMGVLKDSLFETGELLAQVYGGLEVDKTTTDAAGNTEVVKGEKVPIGKHVVGVMMARLILAKAVAARASMVNPPFFIDVFGPIVDPRSQQPLRELREYLFGARLDWRSGLVANLASQRTKFILKGNIFGAEKDIEAAYKVLATPEEGALRKAVRATVVVSSAFTQKR